MEIGGINVIGLIVLASFLWVAINTTELFLHFFLGQKVKDGLRKVAVSTGTAAALFFIWYLTK
jgi:hypothetical protein